jgi:hypothetical protein
MSFDFNYRTNSENIVALEFEVALTFSVAAPVCCAISRINFAMLAACGLLIACSPKIHNYKYGGYISCCATVNTHTIVN